MPSHAKSGEGGAVKSFLSLLSKFGKKKKPKEGKAAAGVAPVGANENPPKAVTPSEPGDALPAPAVEFAAPDTSFATSANHIASNKVLDPVGEASAADAQQAESSQQLAVAHDKLLAALESAQNTETLPRTSRAAYNAADLSGVLFAHRTTQSGAGGLVLPARVAEGAASGINSGDTQQTQSQLNRILERDGVRNSYIPYGTTTVGPQLLNSMANTQNTGLTQESNTICTVTNNLLQDMLYADYEALERLQSRQRGSSSGANALGGAAAIGGGASASASANASGAAARRDMRAPLVAQQQGQGAMHQGVQGLMVARTAGAQQLPAQEAATGGGGQQQQQQQPHDPRQQAGGQQQEYGLGVQQPEQAAPAAVPSSATGPAQEQEQQQHQLKAIQQQSPSAPSPQQQQQQQQPKLATIQPTTAEPQPPPLTTTAVMSPPAPATRTSDRLPPIRASPEVRPAAPPAAAPAPAATAATTAATSPLPTPPRKTSVAAFAASVYGAPGDPEPVPLSRPLRLTTACLGAHTTLCESAADQSFHRLLQRKMQTVYKWLHASDLTAPPDPRLEVPLAELEVEQQQQQTASSSSPRSPGGGAGAEAAGRDAEAAGGA
ncbi:hypothetical protein Agub_g10900, partial [Astrephomene gubernaculifera]